MIASTTTALAAALRRASWRLDRPLRVVVGGNASVPWTLLHVLEEKTRGQISEREKARVDQYLHTLRTAFAEATKSGR